MRALFIQPPAYDFACHDFWLKPYGLLKLAGLFEQNGADVYLFDFLDRFAPDVDGRFRITDPFGRGRLPRTFIPKPEIFRHVPRRFKRYGRIPLAFQTFLKKIMPLDAIFITCTMSYWYPGVEELLPSLDGIPVYLGGTYATLFPEHARSLGIQVVTNADLPVFLSKFGLGLHELQASNPFWKGYSCLPYIVVRLSWGCPYRCTYCAIGSISPDYTIRELGSVLEESRNGLRPETGHLVFYDDALLLHHERLFDLCGNVLRFKNVSFHTPNGLSVDLINEETASGMRKNSFSQIYLGYETADDDLQEKIGRKTSSRAFGRAVAALKKAGYPIGNVHAYLLMGHDLIPPLAVEKSLIEVVHTGVTPHLTEYSPLPGTEDGERILKGFSPDRSVDPLASNKASRTYQWASAATINHLKHLAHAGRDPSG